MGNNIRFSHILKFIIMSISIALLTGCTNQENQSNNFMILNESTPTLNSAILNSNTVTYIYGNSELLVKVFSNGTNSQLVYLYP